MAWPAIARLEAFALRSITPPTWTRAGRWPHSWTISRSETVKLGRRPSYGPPRSGERADPQLLEFDGRPFGFQAEITRARIAAGPAGDFLAVHPQADLAVDAADVVVV